MEETKVNWALITPDLLPLDPEGVPLLETLVFPNDTYDQALIDRWSPHVRVLQSHDWTREYALRSLWATSLGISLKDIRRDDSFFRLGGDSIAALKLGESPEAKDRSCRLRISCETQFFLQWPNLSSMTRPTQWGKISNLSLWYQKNEEKQPGGRLRLGAGWPKTQLRIFILVHLYKKGFWLCRGNQLPLVSTSSVKF